VDRRTALRILGLEADADLATLKRRFRTLARDRHPDRGGDRAAFQDLQAAYERVRADLHDAPSTPRPAVARGRPSRDDDAAERSRLLDRDHLDRAGEALAARVSALRGCRLVSRGPGAWTNRFAASLAVASTSSLELAVMDPQGRGGMLPGTAVQVRAVLTGRGRAGRRALIALDLGAGRGATWSRRRGDAIVVVETVVSGMDAAEAARRAVVATGHLLEVLGWPLATWSEDGSAVAPAPNTGSARA